MQITETLNKGLTRELKIVVAAGELETSLTNRLAEMKNEIRLNGFRPGKVPLSHLRKIYGRSVLAEIIQQTISDTSQKAIEERGEKPALQPVVSLSEDEKEVEAVMSGRADLAYSVTFEVIPKIKPVDFGKIKLEKLVADVADDEVSEAVQRIADEQRDFVAREDKDQAQTGDRVTIDFEGRVDGEPFEGGSASDAPLELGSNSYIPGFEEQIVGARAGDNVDVKTNFPDDYGVGNLAGKAVEFSVAIKSVEEPINVPVDDTLAERLGLGNLDLLRDAVKQQIYEQYDQASTAKIKRSLLDTLDDALDFELPEKLVDQEFEQVWRQVTEDMKQAGRTFSDDDTTEQAARDEFRRIAERRVRLGLLMGQVGEEHNITVTDDEVDTALREQVRQYPGQEKQVYEFYQKNPEAMAGLRAPVFEQKVVDHILSLADVKEKTVSKEDLFRVADEPPVKKKSAAGKTAAKSGKSKPKPKSKSKKAGGTRKPAK